MNHQPTAKQPALASTVKGASLLFQKNQSRVKGCLRVFPGTRADRAFQAELETWDHLRIGLGQSIAQLTGHSARPSGVDGAIEGLIVVNLNGERRGVPSRATKPNEKHETK